MAAASLKELKAALPNSDAAFRESCMDDELTIEQAKDKWTAKVEADLKAAQAEAAQAKADAEAQAAAKAEADKAKAGKPGVQPLTSGKHNAADDEAGSATERFRAAVAEQMKLGKSRAQAVAAVCKAQPELREAYVEEHNAQQAAAGRSA